MKRYIQKAVLLCGYLLLIVMISGFRIEKVLDLREIILVLAGCLLLTIPYILEKKGKVLLEIAGNNSMISAYLVAFVLIIGRTGQMEPGKAVLQDILLCLRPVLYGFAFMILMKSPEKKVTELQRMEPEEKQNSHIVEQYEFGLTKRETEIVKLVLAGLSNREIGEQLYIAESTVKKHMSNIFEKLEVQNREQLKQKLK